ncbi:MAG: alpha/beta fold hydrolase [Verrucomicrobiota bacterium]
MSTRRRLIPRIAFLAIVLALFAIGGVLAWFQSWRTSRMFEIYSQSEVAMLKAGAMEFASRGDGEPVLVFHSAPGGYDQSLALTGFLEEEGFQIIAPSRPGDLRTPLATGITPENQADAAAQLLDHLGHDRVSVLGFGWGGPVAVEFARRFPDRTAALVLVSAVTAQMLPPPAPALQLPHEIADKLTGDVGSWMFVKKSERDPKAALSEAFDMTSLGGAPALAAWLDLVLSRPSEIESFQSLVQSLAPMSPRESGLRNDLLQVRALPPIPLQELKAPTLLVHGGLDKAVPLGPVEQAKSKIPSAEWLILPEEGHLVFQGRGAPVATKRIIDFLNAHSSAPAVEATTDGE